MITTTAEDIAALAEETGGEYRADYSGRGMEGRECVAVVTDDLDGLMMLCFQLGISRPEVDRMGKRWIAYWPEIQGAESHE